MATAQPALVLPSPLDPTAKRVEIDEFIADNVMNNLFLLALRQMQDEKIRKLENEDWFSFYNLSSIHGLPEELWQSVKNKSAEDPDSGWYCTHGSTVFPTWHRLSINMFEQAVYRRMQNIAHTFSDAEGRSDHINALKRFRLPYFDPAMPRIHVNDPSDIKGMFGMPEILVAPKVNVILPKKGKDKVDNPLHHFTFPTEKDWKDTGRTPIPWNGEYLSGFKPPGHIITTRRPDSNGNTDEQALREEFQTQYQDISNDLYHLLNPGGDTNKRAWDVFANHFVNKVSGETWPTNVSLESWHDNIHGLIGSGESDGHMSSVGVANFDPIFWLHHNNVDRLFALYQALYEHLPDKFVAAKAVEPNKLAADSELAPYLKAVKLDQPCFHSDDVRDWTGLGYAMPGNKKLDQHSRKALAEYIRETYFWAADNARPPKSLTYPRNLNHVFALHDNVKFNVDANTPVKFLALEQAQVVEKDFSQQGEPLSVVPLDVTFKDETANKAVHPDGSFTDSNRGTMRTWDVLLRVKKYAFGSSFNIQFFIGKNRVPPGSQAADYFRAPQQANYSTIFAFRSDAKCDNCSTNFDMIYGDTVSLSNSLSKYLRASQAPAGEWPPADLRILSSFDVDQVIPFLQEHLEWRIVDTAGNVKSQDEVRRSGLELVVADRLFTYPKAGSDVDPLGEYGPYSLRPECTRNKVGGYPEGQ